MSNWSAPTECPKCGSKDTRFVEPHYDAFSTNNRSIFNLIQISKIKEQNDNVKFKMLNAPKKNSAFGF